MRAAFDKGGPPVDQSLASVSTSTFQIKPCQLCKTELRNYQVLTPNPRKFSLFLDKLRKAVLMMKHDRETD
jgi:hypothetical protein